MRTVAYPHPGEILLEEFLEPLAITRYRVSKATGISQTALGQIIAGQRALSVENALRLSRFFGTSDEFWMRLQLDFDAAKARKRIGAKLAKIRRFDADAVA